MYINPIYNDNVSMQGKNNPNSWKGFVRNVKQKVFDILPEADFKNRDNAKLNKINDLISRPCENRLIMGFAALMTQPAIDYYNHRVDEETRTVSRNRTIAKIVAGASVGAFVVRGPVYKLVANMTKTDGVTKLSKALLPKDKEMLAKLLEKPEYIKNYRSALAMVFALVAMSVTNFVLDAPLTLFFTDLLNKKSIKKEAKHE